MLTRILSLLLFISVFSCGGPDPTAVETAPAYLRQHPLNAAGTHYLTDSLGFPGNHPTDPVTGELAPQPIRNWSFVDQQNRPFAHQDLRGKVYVADFFFTSCPTICPKVKSQMLRIKERFADREDFALISFTVDPKRDTPEKMLDYATKLGIEDMDRWRFLHGDKFEIYDLDAEYLSIAEENAAAPGGFDHSGYVVLVDRQGRVRSYGSGLDEEEIDHLMRNTELLLNSK